MNSHEILTIKACGNEETNHEKVKIKNQMQVAITNSKKNSNNSKTLKNYRKWIDEKKEQR